QFPSVPRTSLGIRRPTPLPANSPAWSFRFLVDPTGSSSEESSTPPSGEAACPLLADVPARRFHPVCAAASSRPGADRREDDPETGRLRAMISGEACPTLPQQLLLSK